MPNLQIKKLLILQDRDIALQKIEKELANLGHDTNALRASIQKQESTIKALTREIKEKEIRRHELETEIAAKEATVSKFQIQQLEVKKNDEYQAFTRQIQQTKKEISELEEQELEWMFEIDATKKDFETKKAEIHADILGKTEQLKINADHEHNLKDSIKAAGQAVISARADCDADCPEHYDRVKHLVKRPPYVARIEAHKCTGCHLRTSNEVSREAAKATDTLIFCDQCSRIVFA